MKPTITLLWIILAVAPLTVGQAPTPPPSTDIYLADLTATADGVRCGPPRNITRREGYDNQPMFSADGKSVFYTSGRDGRATDIYRYDIVSGDDRQVTKTTEGEYSATLMPDGNSISVIRVEADSTQRLWRFPLAGGAPSLVLQSIKPVGYQAWVDSRTVALFILGSPATLQIVDVLTEKATTVAEGIGRSLHRMPGSRKVSFVHKVSRDEWIVKSFDPDTRQVSVLIPTLPGTEDLTWTPSGLALMAKGGVLYQWRPGTAPNWKEAANLASSGIRDITRLAVSPSGDRLAFVAAP